MEPSGEPQGEPNPARLLDVEPLPKPPSTDDEQRSAAFETWWSVYPRKQSKGAAERAWSSAVKRSDVTVEQLIAGAGRWRDAAALAAPERRKFIPYPATWLNGAKWDDDPLDALGVPAAGPHGRVIQDRDSPTRRIDL